MKKIVSAVFMFMLVLALVACTGKPATAIGNNGPLPTATSQASNVVLNFNATTVPAAEQPAAPAAPVAVAEQPAAPTPMPVDPIQLLLSQQTGGADAFVVGYNGAVGNIAEAAKAKGIDASQKFYDCPAGLPMTWKNLGGSPEVYYISDNKGTLAVLKSDGSTKVNVTMKTGWLGEVAIDVGEQLCVSSDGTNNGHFNLWAERYQANMLTGMSAEDQLAFMQKFAEQELWPRDNKPMHIIVPLSGQVIQ